MLSYFWNFPKALAKLNWLLINILAFVYINIYELLINEWLKCMIPARMAYVGNYNYGISLERIMYEQHVREILCRRGGDEGNNLNNKVGFWESIMMVWMQMNFFFFLVSSRSFSIQTYFNKATISPVWLCRKENTGCLWHYQHCDEKA